MQRRDALKTMAALIGAALIPPQALAGNTARTVLGAAWRGPDRNDPYFAGALVANWQSATLSIRYAVPLPTRPHGLLAEPDGGLLVLGARPGGWLLRCDGQGKIRQQHQLDDEGACRLGGHVVANTAGDLLFTTETDQHTGRGRIGVRERDSLRKVAEWDSHGLDPHQLILDADGSLLVANGGVPRTPQDKKYELKRMDASLLRLDPTTGQRLGQWRLDDPRLSLRHLAWSTASDGTRRLGIALQAEHDSPTQRSAAPVLAIFDGQQLTTPHQGEAGNGYAGDIAAAGNGGFVLSSNQVGLAQLWTPQRQDSLRAVVKLEEAYALTAWSETTQTGGFVVATALGLGRWHPSVAPMLLRWPQPMAMDNHWITLPYPG